MKKIGLFWSEIFTLLMMFYQSRTKSDGQTASEYNDSKLQLNCGQNIF